MIDSALGTDLVPDFVTDSVAGTDLVRYPDPGTVTETGIVRLFKNKIKTK